MLNLDRTIILIGGAPTTGKSTIAQAIANHLNLPWISTDQIRSFLRVTGKPEDHPLLFDSHGMNAEQFFARYSTQEVAEREMKQASAVWPAVKMMIETDYTWDNGFVIEGVNILPSLVNQDFKDNKRIKTVFLVDEDADRIKDVVYNRGLWDDAHTYPDYIKEIEIEWVLQFSHLLKREAEEYGYSCVEVTKRKEDLQSVLSALDL